MPSRTSQVDRGRTVPTNDLLSERMRLCYFGARARMGRDFAYPVVQPVGERVGSSEQAASGIGRSRRMY